MKNTKKSRIYNVYFVRFRVDGKHIDSLPICADNVDVIRLSVLSAPNVPSDTSYDIYYLAQYDNGGHFFVNRSVARPRKVLSGVTPSSNHSRAAEAATPERKEKRNCGKA